MKLLKLTLANFQGIQSLIFEPNGHNANIYGTNGSGKTTVFNAMTWLLFDDASTGEKGFSPKTKGADGEDIHNLDHLVNGTFRLDDGTVTVFAKNLHENWMKKRGSRVEEFSGHQTDYFVDGVPVSKKEYDARLAVICSVDMAQILTQPEYFPESVNWQQRRKILLEICGDVTDFDVINGNDDLQKLNTLLLKPGSTGQFYTMDELQAITGSRMKKINETLDKLPSRIDEAARTLPQLTDTDQPEIRSRLQTLQQERDGLTAEKNNMTAGSAELISRQQLAEIRTQLAESRARYAQQCDPAKSAEYIRIQDLKKERTELDGQISAGQSYLRNFSDDLQSTKRRRERLSVEYIKIKSTEFCGDEQCPFCGQDLPSDRAEQARSDFNLRKSSDMEEIRSRIEAECSKPMIALIEERIQETVNVLSGHDARLYEINNELDSIALPGYPAFEKTAEYIEFAAQIDRIDIAIRQGDKVVDNKKRELQERIDGLMGQIGDEQQKLALLQVYADQQARIAELQAEEKTLNEEYERMQECAYLCEQFIVRKVRMLDDKINGKFESVKFRLFETQINGGIKEGCEVMIPTDNGLVPFKTANNAARINAGLEIIDTLSRHWGIAMPVFVDNAESVVELKSITPQVIRLIVSESDPELRVEVV